MPLPKRSEAVRASGAWTLRCVLGAWRGKTLARDLAWVSPDGARAVCVSASGGGAWDDSALLWTVFDLRDGEALAHGRAALSSEPVVELEFDDDGEGVRALDAGDRVFRVGFARGVATPSFAPPRWGAQRARIEALQPRAPDLFAWGVDPTGRWLLGSEPGANALVRVDLHTDARRAWHEGHVAGVSALVFSGDGALLASSAGGGDLRVWSLEDGACAWTFEPPPRGAVSLRFEGDGRTLSAWGAPGLDADATLSRWSLEGGDLLVRQGLGGAGAESGESALSPDGDVLASLAPSGREVILRGVDRATISLRRLRIPFAMRAARLAFVADGGALRLLGVDGARWCAGDLDVARSLRASEQAVALHPLRVTEVAQEFGEAFLADGGRRALLPARGGARWCDLDTGAPGALVRRGADAPEASRSQALHPALAAFARDARLELWDADGARSLDLDLDAIHDAAGALAIDADGAQLAVGTALGVVLVYRREGWEPPRP